MNNGCCENWEYIFYDALNNQVIDIFETEVIVETNPDAPLCES